MAARQGRNHRIGARAGRRIAEIDAEQPVRTRKGMSLHPPRLVEHGRRPTIHVSRNAVEIGKDRIRADEAKGGRYERQRRLAQADLRGLIAEVADLLEGTVRQTDSQNVEV